MDKSKVGLAAAFALGVLAALLFGGRYEYVARGSHQLWRVNVLTGSVDLCRVEPEGSVRCGGRPRLGLALGEPDATSMDAAAPVE